MKGSRKGKERRNEKYKGTKWEGKERKSREVGRRHRRKEEDMKKKM